MAAAIVAVTLATSAVFAVLAAGVPHDDDLLAFLPEDNPEITTFFSVNKRFGGLDTAIVGLETEDVFEPRFLEALTTITREVGGLGSLSSVLSLANVEDFEPDPAGGIKTGLLIPGPPKDAEGRAALRARVMAKPHLLGNLVSRDGTAVLVIATLGPDAEPRLVASEIQGIVERVLSAPEASLSSTERYYGGNPFVSSYIFDTTQQDMRDLTPWAVLAIVLIMLLAFRDIIGTILALVSTWIGIVVAIGSMALFGESFNIVLGGMPVILFSVGSAYGIHVLSRYYADARHLPPSAALRTTIVRTGPTVIAAGLTTFAGLLSFVAMDIKPLRTFGIFTALGILMTLIFSLTFIPAVVVLMGLEGKADRDDPWPDRLGRFAAGVTRHKLPVVALLAVVAALGSVYTGKVDTRMDTRAFYSEGSLPDRSEAFLQKHFGGSQFAQVYVRGDLKKPEVLRELGRLGDELSLIPHVTETAHIGQVVGLLNDAMEGAKRIPDTSGKVRTLMSLMTAQAGTRQLVTDDREGALLWLKLDSVDPDVLEAVIEAIDERVERFYPGGRRAYVTESVTGPRGPQVRERLQELTAARISAIAHRHALGELDQEGLVAALSAGATAGKSGAPATVAQQEVVAEAVRAYLRSKEALVELPKPVDGVDQALLVGRAAAALGAEPTEDALIASTSKALGKPLDDMTVGDLAFSLESVLAEAWRDVKASGGIDQLAAALGLSQSLADNALARAEMETALMGLAAPTAMLEGGADAAAIHVDVTGLPVLYQGLSRSVKANQFRSLSFALGLVFLIMIVMFRSLTGGLLATVPTALTLLLVYGAMGAMDVHLDIGTSMLASIIIGTGVDYGVHLLDAWRVEDGQPLSQGAHRAAAHTGPAIWTNALAVCAGFFVLTLGDAKPLQNVGALTAAAMLAAAVTTFLAIPALARRRRYSGRADAGGEVA
ncbi:MAG: efflux RND transporter permease subunit [Myxococcota bacterium]